MPAQQVPGSNLAKGVVSNGRGCILGAFGAYPVISTLVSLGLLGGCLGAMGVRPGDLLPAPAASVPQPPASNESDSVSAALPDIEYVQTQPSQGVPASTTGNVVEAFAELGTGLSKVDWGGPVAADPRGKIPGGVAANQVPSQPVPQSNTLAGAVQNCGIGLLVGCSTEQNSNAVQGNGVQQFAQPVTSQPEVTSDNMGMSAYEYSVRAAQNSQTNQGYVEQGQYINSNRCVAEVAGQMGCVEFLRSDGQFVNFNFYDMAGGVHNCTSQINYYNGLGLYSLSSGLAGYSGDSLPQGCQ